jgi:hypothetical protein
VMAYPKSLLQFCAQVVCLERMAERRAGDSEVSYFITQQHHSDKTTDV